MLRGTAVRAQSSDEKDKDFGEAGPRRKPSQSVDWSGWRSSLVLPVLCLVLLLQLWQITLQSSNQRLLQVIVGGPSASTWKFLGSRAKNWTTSIRSLGAFGSSEQEQTPNSQCNCSSAPACPDVFRAAPPSYVPKVYSTCELAIVGGRAADGYGSWPLCVNQVPKDAIVYSFGIGLDVSFDTFMISRGAQVFGFDPTIKPESIPPMMGNKSEELMKHFTFLQVGLGPSNGVTTFLKSATPGIQSMTALKAEESTRAYENVGFQAPVLTLPAIMAIHGHTHVDVLKVDVEGIEFTICETPAFLDALAKVGHLIYEFHERLMKGARARKVACIEQLRQRGFTLVNSTQSHEYVFARVVRDAKVVHLPRQVAN